MVAWVRGGGGTPKDYTKPRQTIQSPKNILQSPQKIIQRPTILDKPQNVRQKLEMLNNSSNKYGFDIKYQIYNTQNKIY